MIRNIIILILICMILDCFNKINEQMSEIREIKATINSMQEDDVALLELHIKLTQRVETLETQINKLFTVFFPPKPPKPPEVPKDKNKTT